MVTMVSCRCRRLLSEGRHSYWTSDVVPVCLQSTSWRLLACLSGQTPTLQMFAGNCRDSAGGFLQYLQGKPRNIYRFTEFAGKI